MTITYASGISCSSSRGSAHLERACLNFWAGLAVDLGGSWALFQVFLISLWTSHLAQACPSHAGGWRTTYQPLKCKPISCFCFCHSHWHPTGQSKVYKEAQSQVVGQVPRSPSLVGRSCQAICMAKGMIQEKKNWGHCCYLPRTVCQNTTSFLERRSKAFTSFSLWPKSSKFQEPPIHIHPWVQGLYLLYSYIFKA